MIEQYIRHPEAKSLGPDGKPCTAETRGILQRAHITGVCYIDKESSPLWNHGDDLSVLTDCDETGFRVTEYGRRTIRYEMRLEKLESRNVPAKAGFTVRLFGKWNAENPSNTRHAENLSNGCTITTATLSRLQATVTTVLGAIDLRYVREGVFCR